MEALLLDGVAIHGLRLLLLTSEWTGPVDGVVRTRADAMLDGLGSLVQRVELRRAGDNDQEPTASEDDGQWTTSTVDAARFRDVCKRFDVVELPACVLVDAIGNLVKAEHIDSLVHEHRLGQDKAAGIQALLQLTDASLVPAVDAPWWTAIDAQHPGNRLDSNPEVVRMREQAATLFEGGELLAAAARFMQVLTLSPRCTKSDFNLAVILHLLGETYFAATLMLRVVMIDDGDSVAHTVLRTVYFQEESARVLEGYRAVIAASPSDHVRAVHALATLEGDAVSAAPQYVREVFDELADSFEEKLVTHLEYRVPWQLVDALQRLEPAVFTASATPTWVVADVGCGTGLCGRLLRPHVKRMIGVDISPLMIDKARASGFYDDLHTTDIAPFLASCADRSLDLVISADVWIYVGALEEVFSLCSRKLQADTGRLAFSIETLEQSDAPDSAAPFRLARSGRFQHAHRYIETLSRANSLEIVLNERVDVRKESGQPIPGRIYVLQRSASHSA